MKQEVESLEREIVTLRAETGRLSATVNRLRTDPDFIEQMAREALGLVKPGERVLKLPPSPGRRER
jgi:cell division protein FtsB